MSATASPIVATPAAAALKTSEASVADARPTNGSLVVRSEPSGAQVHVDGRAVGTTPMTLQDVRPGARQVVVKGEGMEVRQAVLIEPGATVSMIAPLTPKSASATSVVGWLTVTSPAELDVLEDGGLLGTTRSRRIMMEAGAHRLVLANTQLGFERTHDVRIEAGKTAELKVDLPEGTLHINARPWAEVWIDGTRIGETPIGNLSLAIGSHEIVFRHPELGERRITTVVKAAEPTRVAVDLSQGGSDRR